MGKTKLIFLGTGPSQGVPIIGCNCKQCQSKDTRDIRLRTSAILQYKGKNILFDTSPDFRTQLLREKITMIDAVLFTHYHRDHTGGLDELRPIMKFHSEPIPIYVEKQVLEYLKVAFPHILGANKYPGGARLKVNEITDKPFYLEDIQEVIPIRMTHFKGLSILGYRIENFAYLTDCKTIDENNLNKLKGVDYLVINVLNKNPHPSHLSLPEALEIIKYLNPKKSYLTHIGHNLGLYKDVSKELPKGVQLAYDGLNITF